MKNIDELARELAKLYDIEIIETPNSHCFVKQNGDVIPFGDPSFWEAFGLSFFEESPYNFENNTSLIEETSVKISGSPAKSFHIGRFKTDRDSIDTLKPNHQYALAA